MALNRMSANDFRLFNQQLAGLIETNLPLSKSLATLSKQARKPALRRAIQDLQRSVEAGKSLAEAVAERPNAFPPLYAKIIEAGEKSNNLVGVLAQFVKYSEAIADMKERIKDALMYPALLFVSCIVIVSALVFFVLPASTQSALDIVSDAFDEDMPFQHALRGMQTQLFLAEWMPIIVIGVLGLLVLIALAWLVLRATRGGRAALDRVKLRIPLYGKCYRLSLLARFSQTLGLLIESHVPLGDALYLTGQCSPSATVQKACANMQRAVENGRTLSDAMSSENLFGPMMTFMVGVGEKREAPQDELHSAAKMFAANLQVRARRAALWIDTIVVILVALFVIFLARLVYDPVIYLIRAISGAD